MVDFAESGPTVFILGKVTVVFDAEASNLTDALANVRDGIHIQVIHHVASIVIHPDTVVAYFTNDFGALFTCSSLTAVLFNYDGNS